MPTSLWLSTNPADMQVEVIHRFLSEESYWAQGIPLAVVERSLQHSLCFGLFDERRQVAFARVVSDRATYAYLCDVFVLAAYRGRGIARRLLAAVDEHPDLHGLRRWGLVTADAHPLYEHFGYRALAAPDRYMERVDADVYRRKP